MIADWERAKTYTLEYLEAMPSRVTPCNPLLKSVPLRNKCYTLLMPIMKSGGSLRHKPCRFWRCRKPKTNQGKCHQTRDGWVRLCHWNPQKMDPDNLGEKIMLFWKIWSYPRTGTGQMLWAPNTPPWAMPFTCDWLGLHHHRKNYFPKNDGNEHETFQVKGVLFFLPAQHIQFRRQNHFNTAVLGTSFHQFHWTLSGQIPSSGCSDEVGFSIVPFSNKMCTMAVALFW